MISNLYNFSFEWLYISDIVISELSIKELSFFEIEDNFLDAVLLFKTQILHKQKVKKINIQFRTA